MRYCCNCKYYGFDMHLDDCICKISNEPCPNDFVACNKWTDKYEDVRCDNWREYNLNNKRHTRYKQLDKFGIYMKRKHNVWLWTDSAEAHDIMGNHLEW